MNITLTTMDRLTAEQHRAWLAVRECNPALSSPYFHPDFVRLASAVRKGVEVAVLEEGGRPEGFFAFERRSAGAGMPVAAPLNDFQAVIARPELLWSAAELIRGCGLAVWHFDHLLDVGQAFAQHAWSVTPSPYMDLSRGFEAFCEERRAAGGTDLPQARRKRKKAEIQLGPLRFVTHTTDSDVFAALARWKGEQYVRTGLANLFETPWIVALLESIRGAQGAQFSGMLSALYFGDRLAAAHLGMRSGKVLHAWFPAYDPELSRYSPGTILFCEMAKAAAELGIHRIDLGKGPEAFKLCLMSGAVPVAEGAVDFRPVARTLGRWRRSASRWSRQSLLGMPARLVAAVTRPLRQRLALR